MVLLAQGNDERIEPDVKPTPRQQCRLSMLPAFSVCELFGDTIREFQSRPKMVLESPDQIK